MDSASSSANVEQKECELRLCETETLLLNFLSRPYFFVSLIFAVFLFFKGVAAAIRSSSSKTL